MIRSVTEILGTDKLVVIQNQQMTYLLRMMLLLGNQLQGTHHLQVDLVVLEAGPHMLQGDREQDRLLNICWKDTWKTWTPTESMIFLVHHKLKVLMGFSGFLICKVWDY